MSKWIVHSREWFRSTDLWVMGPARFLCATLLKTIWLHKNVDCLKVNFRKSEKAYNYNCSFTCYRGISSIGRALALHARGTGIDARILQFKDSYTRASFTHLLLLSSYFHILGSIVVSIPACHAGDQGSIPCRGGVRLL